MNFAKVQALHDRLLAERRRIVGLLAGVDMLPPRTAISDLADLDAALAAIASLLAERPEPASDEVPVRAVESVDA